MVDEVVPEMDLDELWNTEEVAHVGDFVVVEVDELQATGADLLEEGSAPQLVVGQVKNAQVLPHVRPVQSQVLCVVADLDRLECLEVVSELR